MGASRRPLQLPSRTVSLVLPDCRPILIACCSLCARNESYPDPSEHTTLKIFPGPFRALRSSFDVGQDASHLSQQPENSQASSSLISLQVATSVLGATDTHRSKREVNAPRGRIYQQVRKIRSYTLSDSSQPQFGVLVVCLPPTATPCRCLCLVSDLHAPFAALPRCMT